ncbi:hypothetical protein SUBVAR_07311 [Subdoligranulum variabile DSM 15176]|uniref:Uncharacterized protein n=1 Tax=Subdoligranulum variabile DSM 15176 TaxID=411471 RepID=D1PSC8_9FIRM|nr:hypothetical protein SUBVAR_07311 [Subdoligranulum variabile DSM 15176]
MRCGSTVFAAKRPVPGQSGGKAKACFGRIVSRVYIAILLLLLLLTVSQVCVRARNFWLSKEPTYKI